MQTKNDVCIKVMAKVQVQVPQRTVLLIDSSPFFPLSYLIPLYRVLVGVSNLSLSAT